MTSAVPRESIDFATAIDGRFEAHKDLLEGDEDLAAVNEVRNRVRAQIIAAADRGRVAFDSNQTLEQEQEQEQEQEREQEQEIEIEKFQDLAYARDNEEPVPWKFETLARWDDDDDDAGEAAADEGGESAEGAKKKESGAGDNDDDDDDDEAAKGDEKAKAKSGKSKALEASGEAGKHVVRDWPRQFYAGADFHLHRRRAFPLPDDILLSENYFNPRWSGPRRIKNIVAVLEWTPDVADVRDDERALRDVLPAAMADQCASAAELALRFCDPCEHDALPLGSVVALARALLPFDGARVKQAAQLLAEAQDERGLVPRSRVAELLLSGALRQRQQRRRFVLLSLAEAQTVRRILHLRQGGPPIAGAAAQMQLRLLPAGFAALDKSTGFEDGYSYQVCWLLLFFIFADCLYFC